MKPLREYVQKVREIGERMDTWLIRHAFDKFYKTSGVKCQIYPYDFSRENPLATSFLGWDYLLDGFGDVSRRDPNKRR